MKKGDVCQGVVETVDFPGRGRVSVNGENVTVKNTIPGQEVEFVINKKKHGLFEGRLLRILKPSPLEKRQPVCSSFPECGGCMYQTMRYEDQLELKKEQVQKLLAPVLGADFRLEGIKPSPLEFSYRNKMEFSFGDAYKDGPLTLGLHKKGSTYDVLSAADCKLVHEDLTKILRCVLEYFRTKEIPFYQKKQHTGYLRHLLLRRGDTTGEILVCLVTTTQEEADLSPLVSRLLDLRLQGKIVGILHILNDALSDVVQSDETRLLYGQDYFYEELLGLKFQITPFSFFQPNSRAAEVLYQTVQEYMGESKGGLVLDLYCGTGTISLLCAAEAGEVIGVEIVEEAVEAARENARRNGISNCRFIAGDVLKVLDELEEKPDMIILDPPREGLHPKALPKILAYGVEQMIYISCKPTSLARDLRAIGQAGYQVQRCVCVDQFVHTVHVETVVLLSRHPEKKIRDVTSCENIPDGP